jgi:quercetin dioxygenase-like cupin family protein
MKHVKLLETMRYSDENIIMDELMETPYSKEIRIAMQRNQVMRDHQSSFPITMQVIEGEIRVSCESYETLLKANELLSMEAGVKHHIEATQDTVVRLTLFSCAPTAENALCGM